ncbi:MAG TPA: hypothetical protein VJO33_17160 [Gemmatimonadaceae bacterium]|nr:hypothetical protein [Gemmatimonadaceae bacterium]
MSWHIKRAGKGMDVAAEIGKAAESEEKQAYHLPVAKETIARSAKTLTELATMFPDKTVIASTIGHVSEVGASLTVSFEIVP